MRSSAETVEAARAAVADFGDRTSTPWEPTHDACHLCLGVGRCPECGGDGMRQDGPSDNELRRQRKRRELARCLAALEAAAEEVRMELEGI